MADDGLADHQRTDEQPLDHELLVHVLGEIRRRGGIGTQSVADAIRHSERFVAALPDGLAVGADLGSGGGLPALVLALRKPRMQWHLIERRATRADLLGYAVRALGLGERVTVHAADAARVADQRLPVEVVTARSFAPATVTLATAASLLQHAESGGWILVSAPPQGTAPVDRGVLDRIGVTDLGTIEGVDRYRMMFHVEPNRG
jgi:hypothetical protein